MCQVIPAGGSSTLYISFTPMVLSPEALHKVECVGYALGFMSLDSEVSLRDWMYVCCRLSPGTASDGLGLRRWKGNFQEGGVACRTLL